MTDAWPICISTCDFLCNFVSSKLSLKVPACPGVPSQGGPSMWDKLTLSWTWQGEGGLWDKENRSETGFGYRTPKRGPELSWAPPHGLSISGSVLQEASVHSGSCVLHCLCIFSPLTHPSSQQGAYCQNPPPTSPVYVFAFARYVLPICFYFSEYPSHCDSDYWVIRGLLLLIGSLYFPLTSIDISPFLELKFVEKLMAKFFFFTFVSNLVLLSGGF